MKNKNLGKNNLEKNETSPLLKPPQKDFQSYIREQGFSDFSM